MYKHYYIGELLHTTGRVDRKNVHVKNIQARRFLRIFVLFFALTKHHKGKLHLIQVMIEFHCIWWQYVNIPVAVRSCIVNTTSTSTWLSPDLTRLRNKLLLSSCTKCVVCSNPTNTTGRRGNERRKGGRGRQGKKGGRRGREEGRKEEKGGEEGREEGEYYIYHVWHIFISNLWILKSWQTRNEAYLTILIIDEHRGCVINERDALLPWGDCQLSKESFCPFHSIVV